MTGTHDSILAGDPFPSVFYIGLFGAGVSGRVGAAGIRVVWDHHAGAVCRHFGIHAWAGRWIMVGGAVDRVAG
jgi:hypothetical protein